MQLSRSEKFDKLLVLLPVILGPLILFGQALFTGRVLYWGLPALQFIPWRFFAWENIQQGIIPLWNALNGMGAPLLANYQLALFYPPGWLVYLFAALGGISWLAWSHTLLIVLHLIWAGLGLARLARKIGLQPLAQSLCGLSFGLTGYFVARGGFFSMIWAGAWIPWIFLYVSDLGMPVRVEPGEVRQKILHLPLVFAITMQLLAGHAQLSWYTLTLATVWVVVGKWVNSGFRQACSALARFALAAVLAAVISSIQLLPTLEYLQQSQRSAAVSYETAMTYSFWPWRLISLFAPDFFGNPGSGNYWGYASFWEDAAYIGLVPMLLALSTFTDLFLRKRKGQPPDKFQLLNTFLWGTAGPGVVLALGKNTPIFPFLYRYVPGSQPVYDLVRPGLLPVGWPWGGKMAYPDRKRAVLVPAVHGRYGFSHFWSDPGRHIYQRRYPFFFYPCGGHCRIMGFRRRAINSAQNTRRKKRQTGHLGGSRRHLGWPGPDPGRLESEPISSGSFLPVHAAWEYTGQPANERSSALPQPK